MIRTTLITLILIASSLQAQVQDSSRKSKDELLRGVNMAFEIYGSVFRELIYNYVVDINPEELMNAGINGMLSALDPYTNYTSSSESNEIDLMMSDMYVGIGIQTDTVDGKLTIVNVYRNSPAFHSGLRIGDNIFSVDSTFLLYDDGSNLRQRTIGKKGTSLTMKVLREGVADTLIKEITRDEVIISIIPNQTIVRDNIGYIKLEQFSSGAAQEFKTAFLNLYRRTKLKGMIIDLRENPGGLISSAVEISEFFLPKEIDIVRTKGRNKNEFTYKTLMNPIDTNIPLIIIINENSASASEILAGAFQDLDRALIVGTRSFGKGLVQSVDEVPYGGSIKVTTAKYYIPSGRCIQKLDYKIAKDKKGLSLHHDSVFYTRNQRPVYESSGIQPDVFVDHDTLNNYCRILEDKLAFFRFANKYTGPLDTLSIDFSVDDKLLTEFRIYTSQIGIKTDGDYYQRLIALKNDSKQHLGKNLQLKLDNLIKDFEKLGNKDFEQNKEYVRKRLNQEILMRFYSFEAVEEKFFDTDKTIQKSIELMLSEEIDRILSSPKTK